jgi:hypothetical protein
MEDIKTTDWIENSYLVNRNELDFFVFIYSTYRVSDS